MAKFVRGACENFCPEQEAKLRTKERLLHFFELKNGQKNVPGTLVKSFSRSAAGVKRPKPQDLRTEQSLQRTVEYLLKDILLDKRKPYNQVYDFIFDRLRAVRQEIVIQEYNATKTIKLIEPMILFLAYSRYRLCEESMDNFDTKICEQHLQECLKRVLCCYDEISSNNRTQNFTLREIHKRNFIEVIYQLFNLGSIEALRRSTQLPKDVRNDPLFAAAYSIAINYFQGNIYRVLNGIKKLPHILCAITSIKLQHIRRQVYEIFAHAYNNKQLPVSIDFICRLTNYTTEHDLFTDCKYYNLAVTPDRTGIYFVKSDFKKDIATPTARHENIVEEKLKKIYLPEVLLLKRLSY